MASKGTGLGHLHYEIMRRCYNEKSVAYKDYGAKGIRVCEEWHDRPTFIQWCKDNGWQKGLKINRYDGKKDYCPENCYMGTNMSRNPSSTNQKNKRAHNQRVKKIKEAGVTGKIIDDELYSTYHSMHQRCENKHHVNYPNYGGRGISVCGEWSGKDGFLNFKKWANKNYWAEGLTLDRKDNDKGYSPDNCRWVTKTQQSYNRRNSSVMYEYANVVIPLGMIAKLEEVDYCMLKNRIENKGMSVSQAIVDIKKSAV